MGKELSGPSIAAVGAACKEADSLPEEIVATFECWCILHGETPVSVSRCGELAADASDFKLVGPSSIRCMSAEERVDVKRRIGSMDPAATRTRPLAAPEAAAAMLEWLQ